MSANPIMLSLFHLTKRCPLQSALRQSSEADRKGRQQNNGKDSWIALALFEGRLMANRRNLSGRSFADVDGTLLSAKYLMPCRVGCRFADCGVGAPIPAPACS